MFQMLSQTQTHTLYLLRVAKGLLSFEKERKKLSFSLMSYLLSWSLFNVLSIPVNFRAVTTIINPPLKHNCWETDTKKKGEEERKWRGDMERGKEKSRRWPIKRKNKSVRQKKYQQTWHFVGEKRQRNELLGLIHHFTICFWLMVLWIRIWHQS